MIDMNIRWGELFTQLGLTPGVAAFNRRPYDFSLVLDDLRNGTRGSSVELRLSFMSGLLEPFFCPFVTQADVFEIARAGESSPEMFQLFNGRSSIDIVLNRCKQLKQTRVGELAYRTPSAIATIISEFFTSDIERDISMEWCQNFATFFHSPEAEREARILASLLTNAEAPPVVDVHLLSTAFPGWLLLAEDEQPGLWAARNDEFALLLKNLSIPGLEQRQRHALRMMSEAAATFLRIGAPNDAAIAKSNLANLLGHVSWMTIEEQIRRAEPLYREALDLTTDPAFRALVMDNLAGLKSKMLALGATASHSEAMELSVAAVSTLADDHPETPLAITNAIRHILETRRESRAEDLKQARDLGLRGLQLVDSLGVDPRNEFLSAFADAYLRSTDYAHEERQAFAREALKLLDLRKSDPAESKESAQYVRYLRGQALSLLGEHGLAHAEFDRNVTGEDPSLEDDAVYASLSRRYDELAKMLPPGHPARVAAAEERADLARQIGDLAEWLASETSLLYEHTYIAGSMAHSSEDHILRAENVLLQCSSDSSEANRLQCVLISAYGIRALATHQREDLLSAIAHIETLISASEFDRFSAISNTLLSWIQFVWIWFDEDIDVARVATLSADTEQRATTLVATARVDNGESRICKATIWTCRIARHLCDLILSGGTATPTVLRGLAGSFCAEAEALSHDSDQNREWLLPVLYEAAGHTFAACRDQDDAKRAFERALEAVDQYGGAMKDRARPRVVESLCQCALDSNLADGVRLLSGNTGFAAAWTLEYEDASKRKEEQYSATLRAFEELCVAKAMAAGIVQSPQEISVSEAQNTLSSQNQKLQKRGGSALDSHGIDVTKLTPSSDHIVILLPGRRFGRAVLLRRGTDVTDANEIPLPRYSQRVALSLLMDSSEGWIPATLTWRSKRNTKAFDRAIRRTSLALWEAVWAPLHEGMHALGLHGKIQLVTTRDQALLPWTIASGTSSLEYTAGDLWDVSVVRDLSILALAEHRRQQPRRPKAGMELLQALLVGAPLLGIDLEVIDQVFTQRLNALSVFSIGDGLGDLPMSRIECAAALTGNAAGVAISGGVIPLAMPYAVALFESAKILHFACHAVWSPTQPWMTSLRLGEEVAIGAAMIRARMRLIADVVVLSACESGLGGPQGAGEGSLPEAFILAGAQAVVASSWVVHDLSSLVFTASLFGSLSKEPNLPTAVRAARRQTRETTRDSLAGKIAAWEEQFPQLRESLQRSFETLGEDLVPFSAPVYWGAPFVMSP